MKKSNSAFYAGVTFLIVVASFLYSWKFIIPKYHENQIASTQLDSEISGADKQLESLKKAQSTLTQLGDIPHQLTLAVPEDKDMPNLITELEAVAAKYNIILPAIAVSDGSGASADAAAGTVSTVAGNTISFSFSLPGSFDDLHGLIGAFEKDIRFMNIKSVSISTSTDSKGASSLSVSMQIEAYKRGASAAAAPTASVPTAVAPTTPAVDTAN